MTIRLIHHTFQLNVEVPIKQTQTLGNCSIKTSMCMKRVNSPKSMTKLSKYEKEDTKKETNSCVPESEMTVLAHPLVLPFPMSKSCLVL